MISSQSEFPSISVIIPSFNQGQYIEQTIASILGQNYPNLELIIIDGGSTDNTHSIIQKYISSINYYVSEPDNGQAHAINKGFRLAKGDVLAWLNSDDMYLPCTFLKVINILKCQEKPALVYGGCLHFKEGTQQTFGSLPPLFDADLLKYYDYISQPSTFWSRSLWKEVGELNESYNYVLDWDWFIRASKICKFVPLSEYLSIYRFHNSHKTGTGGLSRSKEILQVVEEYADKDLIAVYRKLYESAPYVKARINLLIKLKLYRLRKLFLPGLYLKFDEKHIESALGML